MVAAHDSAQPKGADYFCDGLDDQVEIQAAIYELECYGGGRLLFLEGHYYLSPEGEYCVTLVSDLTLEGEGDACLQLVGEPTRGMFITKDWRWNPPYVKVNNVNLTNLTIDVDSPHGFWRDNEWGKYWEFHVLCGSIDCLTLDNVHFVSHNPESVTSRLFLSQCNHIDIVRCNFDGVSAWIFSNTAQADPTSITGEHCLVKECTFTNTSVDSFAIGGNMIGFTVIDSEFFNIGHTPIDLAISPDAVAMRNTISGVKSGAGIYSEGAYDVTIKNNIIDNVASEGEWGGFGIGTSDAVHMRVGGNVVIEDNTITNVGVGIYSFGVPDVTIRNNDIMGAERHGIELTPITEGGKFYDGIPSYADECRVLNNTIVDFGRDYQWARGVFLSNVEYCEVSGNYIDGGDNEGAVQGIGEHHYLHPDIPNNRPDYNIIENNTIVGVDTPVEVFGPNTIVQSNKVE